MAGKALEIEKEVVSTKDRLKILIFSIVLFIFFPFNNTLLVSYSFLHKDAIRLFRKIHHQVVFFISSLFCDIVSYRKNEESEDVCY